MTISITLLVAAGAVLQFAGFSAGSRHATENLEPLPDSTRVGKLTIVRIKKPWYAWRGLIVSKMKESVPQYQVIDGLQYKYFNLSENGKLFGGIYFWKTEDDARKWFNNDWFNRTQKKYGEKGKVQYFSIHNITMYQRDNASTAGNWAVLTYSGEREFEIIQPVNGLINLVSLKDDANQVCYLTFWRSKKDAETFFASTTFSNEYFDTPVLLNNAK